MEQILNIIRENTIPDIRSSFYYLGRYLKQADSFEEYQKDIFEDDEKSTPSDLVKAITLRLIETIEQLADKKAKHFEDAEYLHWINIINNIEENLDPTPNSSLIDKVTFELNNFKPLGKK